MENGNKQLSQEKMDFLLEIAYVTEQIAHAHITVKEGYGKLTYLIGEKKY